MAKPKMLGQVQSLNAKAPNQDFFSMKYSLRAKAGGEEGLAIGQVIYCLPLVKDGVYEFSCHAVRAYETSGFKNKFNTYVQCHGTNEETGEYNPECECCRLAQEEWNKFIAHGKTGETKVSFRASRFYIPIMLLGNNSGKKVASDIPISKLTMTGRDYSYLELSQRGFNDLIELLKNDLINNGRMEYGLEGADLLNELLKQMTKHVMKISINKPDGFGKHKKVYSFISFDNKNIGAETGAYQNITEGLTKSPKLMAEAEEYLTLFSTEVDNILTPWEDGELEQYVQGKKSPSFSTTTTSEYVIKEEEIIPKAEQIVVEDGYEADDADDDLFESDHSITSDISLDDTQVSSDLGSVSFNEEDMSFDMANGEEFFNRNNGEI